MANKTSDRSPDLTNVGVRSTLGMAPPNHGGPDPDSAPEDDSHTVQGSSGNPGIDLPWEGADSTLKPGEVPPITHLGG